MAETSDETSYDVFEWFPILVCQNIFKYLDGKDVIQASAVNKEWYKLCAESEQAKKLKLVLRDSQNHVLTDEDVELLKNSKRKYENIVLDESDDESIELLSKLLRNNHNLKDLAVSTTGPLLENSSKFKFKLDKLVIHGDTFGQTDLVALYAFLETQAQTLKSLAIYVRLNLACLELILSMPNLSSLTTVFPEHPIVQANTTITSLELPTDMGSRTRDAFEALIRSLTSLKHFKCCDINNDELDFLAREVPALESFTADRLFVTRFPEGDIFPNLKEFKVGDFSRRLQEPTGDHSFAKLARKAMRES